jgi:RNA-directed DNA polymerase
MRNRKAEIPKEGGKVRVLGIPTIRDRVVQGALKLILEPIFESDFQDGSYGYRPKRTAHQAVARVSEAVLMGLTRVIDLDLKSYFDTVSHSIILRKVAGPATVRAGLQPGQFPEASRTAGERQALDAHDAAGHAC